MKRDLQVYFEDILDSIDLIEKYTANITKVEFIKSLKIQDAVIRRYEIIGEAVKHIPQDFKKDYPKVPWKKIVGARDVFVHEYFGVKVERIWDSITNDLGPLKKQIRTMIEEYKT
ncbi:MAG: hypothetical protein US51_C0028G0007 [Microgenomates group bacterium GW2011_GWA2_37_6]|nr:MAG: hypothetical protein US51_C0028G0007 [Microgenomates group bacterium GW2011_GWA2_37_6]